MSEKSWKQIREELKTLPRQMCVTPVAEALEYIDEILKLQEQLQSAQQEIGALRQERNKLIEGLRSIRNELDRRFWESDRKWEREADMYEQGKSAAYGEADALICNILHEIGGTVE